MVWWWLADLTGVPTAEGPSYLTERLVGNARVQIFGVLTRGNKHVRVGSP
jgi:hypothetical protein